MKIPEGLHMYIHLVYTVRCSNMVLLLSMILCLEGPFPVGCPGSILDFLMNQHLYWKVLQ